MNENNCSILNLKLELNKKHIFSLKINTEKVEHKLSLFSETLGLDRSDLKFKIGKLNEVSIKLLTNTANKGLSCLNCKMLNGFKLTKAKEQGIFNKVIIDSFSSYMQFNGTTFSYMRMYLNNKDRNNSYFPMNDNTCNEILKYHQQSIKDIESYRKMKPKDVINNKVYDEIKFFI